MLFRKLFPIYLITLVNILGFSLFLPVLLFIIQNYTTTEFQTNIRYALLSAVYPLFAFFAAPLRGSYSDKYGRKPILLISLGGTVFSLLLFFSSFRLPHTRLFGLTLPLVVILIARMLDGVTGGNMGVVVASIADSTTFDQRGQAYGWFGAMIAIGLSIGPLLGGRIGENRGYQWSVATAMAISLIAWIWTRWGYTETLQEHHKITSLARIGQELNIVYQFRQVVKTKTLQQFFLVEIAFLLSFATYITLNLKIMEANLGLDGMQIGWVYILIGGVLFITQSFLVKILSHHIGEHKTYRIGISTVTVAYLWLSRGSLHLVSFLIGIAILTIGIGLSLSLFKTIVSKQVSPRMQGKIAGLDEGINSASLAIGPIIAMVSYQFIGTYTFSILGLMLTIPLGIKILYSYFFPDNHDEHH